MAIEIDELNKTLYGETLVAIYGPYYAKDNRARLVLYYGSKNSNITISYPKYLIERKLKRNLDDDETTDHIDEDVTNNDINNLRVLLRSDNISAYQANRPRQKIYLLCEECGTEFWNWKKQQKYRPQRFCGKRCVGLASHK